MLGTYHLSILYDILRDIHFLYETDKIYSYLLENVVKALDADAASLFIADDARENLRLKACIGPKKGMLEMIAEEIPFPFGKGVCGWVAHFNQPLIIDSVQSDARFNPQVDTLTGYKTKSILCAPIASKDEVLGVIEVLNKKSAAFNKNDQDLVAVIARQAAIALQNGRLMRELKTARNLNDAILANLTGGFVAVDPGGTVTHFNPAAEKILLLSQVDSIGKPHAEVLARYPQLAAELGDALHNKQPKSRQELRCMRPNQTEVRIGYSTFLVQEAKDSLLGAALTFQDLTDVA